MALDESILAEVQKGASPPTVRIYGWSPPCISVGQHQHTAKELDLPEVARRGYDVVTRLTGGRAVLHAEEFTYSVIAPTEAASWCAAPAAAYDRIAHALLCALKPYAPLEMRRESGYPREKPGENVPMSPCFASAARTEITWEGRKVVGSAQRRLRGAFLQHGSILLSRRHLELAELIRADADVVRAYRKRLGSGSAVLEEAAGKRVYWEDLACGFMERFAAGLGVACVPGAPSAAESVDCQSRAREKQALQARLLASQGKTICFSSRT